MVRSRERTRVRLAHRIGCQTHGMQSGSSWTSRICGPRLCVDCGQSWSTRSGHPWATGTDRASASCRSSPQLNPTPSSNLLGEITGFQPPNSKIGVLHQPLARRFAGRKRRRSGHNLRLRKCYLSGDCCGQEKTPRAVKLRTSFGSPPPELPNHVPILGPFGTTVNVTFVM